MQAIVDALQHKQLEATVIEGNGDQKKSTISETVTEVHASPPPGASPRRRVRKSRAADLEPAPAPGPPTPDGPAALPGT
jgi:hypothetical protein